VQGPNELGTPKGHMHGHVESRECRGAGFLPLPLRTRRGLGHAQQELWRRDSDECRLRKKQEATSTSQHCQLTGSLAVVMRGAGDGPTGRALFNEGVWLCARARVL